MSQRTRANRVRKPGVASVNKPARYARRVEHRKVRRAAHIELATMTEPEDHALPRPVHTSMKSDPHDRPETSAKSTRFKVWKTKAWKRRKLERSHKAAAYKALG